MMSGKDGYVNAAFSTSQQGLARFLKRRRSEPSSVEAPSQPEVDPDTDLDMDSFLSDLEKNSARRDSDMMSGITVNFDDADGFLRFADDSSIRDSQHSAHSNPGLQEKAADNSLVSDSTKPIVQSVAAGHPLNPIVKYRIGEALPRDGARVGADRFGSEFNNPYDASTVDSVSTRQLSMSSQQQLDPVHRGQSLPSRRRQSDNSDSIADNSSGVSRSNVRSSVRLTKKFTPRSAAPPPSIPEEIEEDRKLSLQLAQNEDLSLPVQESVRRQDRPEARLVNLFGLIDQRKVSQLLSLLHDSQKEENNKVRESEISDKYPRTGTNPSTNWTCLMGVVSLATLIICMSSPYWLSSWDSTNSPFSNLGPWEACFRRFRFPKFQFDRLFHGCHAVWGTEYRLIREWLLPPWFLTIQAFLIISLVLSVLARCISVMVLYREPMLIMLRFGYQITLAVTLLDLLIGILLSLSTIIFSVSCWSREWILYPNYNYLSWGWVAAFLASILHLASSALFLKQARIHKLKKEFNQQLLQQLETPAVLSPPGSGIYV